MTMEQDRSQHDRRTFSRVPFTAKVAIVGERSHWIAELIDISMKGVLLVRPVEWPGQLGKGYQLKIPLGDNKIVITMDASLAHSSHECLGFCCEHIDLDSMTHLRRLLELNIGDEERINHELSALIFMHNNPSGGR
jgi:hypothetical protein